MDELIKQLIGLDVGRGWNRRVLIALGGSVSVGKSTFAQQVSNQLKAAGVKSQVIASDGFLFDNQSLTDQGLFDQKGFPVSYDWPTFQQFLKQARDINQTPAAPLYTQALSNIDPDVVQQINSETTMVIVEGINVLQTEVKDLFDLTLYLDADLDDLKSWYLKRSVDNIVAARENPSSWYYQFRDYSEDELETMVMSVWDSVNQVNIDRYIEPTRQFAKQIIKLNSQHEVDKIMSL